MGTSWGCSGSVSETLEQSEGGRTEEQLRQRSSYEGSLQEGRSFGTCSLIKIRFLCRVRGVAKSTAQVLSAPFNPLWPPTRAKSQGGGELSPG